jgi:hypothetical protein
MGILINAHCSFYGLGSRSIDALIPHRAQHFTFSFLSTLPIRTPKPTTAS